MKLRSGFVCTAYAVTYVQCLDRRDPGRRPARVFRLGQNVQLQLLGGKKPQTMPGGHSPQQFGA